MIRAIRRWLQEPLVQFLLAGMLLFAGYHWVNGKSGRPDPSGRIEITANSPDVGEARESMDVAYSGKPMQIAFNPDFLKAPLQNLDTASVYLDLIDEMSPGVIRIDGSFLYVLMPMRVTS